MESGIFYGQGIYTVNHSFCPPSQRCRKGWHRTVNKTSAPEGKNILIYVSSIEINFR